MKNIKRYRDHLRESQDSQAAPNPWLVYCWDLKAPPKEMDPKFRQIGYRPYFLSAHATEEEARTAWEAVVESTWRKIFIEDMEERTPPQFKSPDDMKARGPEEYQALRRSVIDSIARNRTPMFCMASLEDLLSHRAKGFEDYGESAEENLEFFIDHIRTSDDAPDWLKSSMRRRQRSRSAFGRF